MESTIVIKVEYGKTLRRFNARVNEAGKLELSVDGLREKVHTLFSLSADTDLTLTYLDEDGDSVTIADEEDLCDVMRQSLNPLRITVKVNSEKARSSNARSTGNSTPLGSSPKVSCRLPNLNYSISEIFKAVPEPMGEPLSKLLAELAYKVVSSSPQLPEPVQRLSNMLQSHLVPASDTQVGTDSSTRTVDSESSSKISSMPKEPQASVDADYSSKVVPIAKSGKTVESVAEVDLPGSTVEECIVAIPASGSLNLNADHKSDGKQGAKESGERSSKAGDGKLAEEIITAVASSIPGTDYKDFKKPGEEWDYVAPVSLSSNTFLDQNFGSNANNLSGSTSTGGMLNQNVAGECPVAGTPIANESNFRNSHIGPQVHPSKRSCSQVGTAGIFHRGVRCDGCGVHPITGPRFKSKMKENYDLCSICFAEMGNEADYTRLDRPIPYWHPHHSNALHRSVQCDGCGVHPITGPRFKSKVKEDYDLCSICFAEMGNEADYTRLYHPIPRWLTKRSNGQYDFQVPVNPPTLPHGLKDMVAENQGKLDSQFIMDVNVIDGTLMAPLTPFTKIWRMRNTGTLVWPQGTELVWIGGDRFSALCSVGLQIPGDGLPADNELEVAVDFTAPALPGRYISYWRLASPSGQRFGQQVWVLIQVDTSLDDAVCSSFQGLNLNMPPESSGMAGAGSISIEVEPIVVDGQLPKPVTSKRATELVEPLLELSPINDQDLNFLINDNLLASGLSITPPPKVMAPTTVSYPTIDLSAVEPVLASLAPMLSTNAGSSSQMTGRKDDVEQTLLMELEEMGFKRVDLNKEILRKNEYNLEQTLYDLCDVSEWDPILKELQEMGFCDIEMNKKLLKKNNGSIKDVVMDLITGENAQSYDMGL